MNTSTSSVTRDRTLHRRVAQIVALAMAALALVATVGSNGADAGGSTVDLELKGVYLEGPLPPTAGSTILPIMNTVLWFSGAVPTTEPFTDAGYTQPKFENKGYEATAVPETVDWVLVELRNKNDIDTVVAARAAFLTVDGQVITEDGGPLTFNVSGGCYYVAVQHRNHLGYASNDLVHLQAGQKVNTYTMGDSVQQCSTKNTGIYTSPGQSPAPFQSYTVNGETIYVMVAGDTTFDGVINAADRSRVVNDLMLSGYQVSDVNLLGDVNNDDRDIVWDNKNIVQPYGM